jgi:hypothetical protein
LINLSITSNPSGPFERNPIEKDFEKEKIIERI